MLDADAADLEEMRADIVEMERMLDEYLQFARGEAGEAPQETDLGGLLLDAAKAVSKARNSENRIVVSADEGFVVSIRRDAIRRCVTNLIDNALKHGKHVEARLSGSGKFAQIVVDDDGPGIPEARREEAFRPFHRLDEGRNLQTGGVGLGLAIARDIARAHGGDLVLGNSAMGGLRAIVRLPT
jgi:two-component system osmolarity sensor histidine kinase EnvZ